MTTIIERIAARVASLQRLMWECDLAATRLICRGDRDAAALGFDARDGVAARVRRWQRVLADRYGVEVR